MPERIQLRRAKGWRMPPNTVKVDRTTRFGNPFIVGKHGPRAECVRLFDMLMSGMVCLSIDRECIDAQKALLDRLRAEKRNGFPSLRGKNLACWCPVGAPCHANVLLSIANESATDGPEGGA